MVVLMFASELHQYDAVQNRTTIEKNVFKLDIHILEFCSNIPSKFF